MSKHTSTPWRNACFQVYGSGNSRIAHTGMGQLPPSRSTESEANAAFIVRAVNSYDALVTALEDAIAAIRPSAGPEEKLNAERAGQAALVLAKGGGK